MLYLVKYYEENTEFTDVITHYDFENYSEADEFHYVQKVRNYDELEKLLEGCEVVYKDINYLLDIGKDIFKITDCLEEIIDSEYESPEEVEKTVIKALEKNYKNIRARHFKNKTCIGSLDMKVDLIFRINYQPDNKYSISELNFL